VAREQAVRLEEVESQLAEAKKQASGHDEVVAELRGQLEQAVSGKDALIAEQLKSMEEKPATPDVTPPGATTKTTKTKGGK
jgi:uncharacterized coiled-coil protein SlyX